MMYILRCVIATLSVSAISYVLLSTMVALCWRLFVRAAKSQSSITRARALYAIRVAPLLGAACIAACFELPSFLVLEPKAAEEVLNLLPLGLSVLAAVFVSGSVLRMVRTCLQTSRAAERWMAGGGVPERAGAAAYDANDFGPPVAVVGIRKPRLMVSREVESVLDREELERAIAHEVAHIRHHDNLRKLTLGLCSFPGMAGLESAWAEAAEFAADELAVSNRREALALASALVKISGMRLPVIGPHLLVTNLVGEPGSTARRVQRLSEWNAAEPKQGSRLLVIAAVFVSGVGLTLVYGPLLAHVHELTELLFR